MTDSNYSHRKEIAFLMLYAAVVLNDHVHIIINPFESLPKIMHSIKSFTAHEINKILERKGKVWQNESYDRL